MISVTSDKHLSSGNMNMPVVGLGTWQLEENVQNGEEAIISALDAGYRHLDTAFVYENESTIGNALTKYFASGRCKRAELFVVTKLPPSCNRPELVEPFLKKSLENLKLEYVDLYLIHWPTGLKYNENNGVDKWGNLELDLETDIVALWKGMEKQVKAGRAKSIGLSNFNINQIQRILKEASIKPANLQVELYLYFQQKELLEFCKQNNISVCAYAPLGSPGLKHFTSKYGITMDNLPTTSPMNDPVVIEIATKHNKLPSQVLLRFILQLGAAVIPKSTNPERIKGNIQLFDFELDEGEMKRLRALDRGEKARLFSCEFFKGIEKHPEYPF